MPVDLKTYSAACILVGVDPPEWHDARQWYELKWTPDNWEAFLAVNHAYGVFDTSAGKNNIIAKERSGWIPVLPQTFGLLTGVTYARTSSRKKQRLKVGRRARGVPQVP
jgi:hypothetical protein